MAQFFSTNLGQILLTSFLIYVFFAGAFYIASDYVIFQPPPKSVAPRYEQQDIYLKLDNKTTIHAVYLANPKASYTILFSHGNAEDLVTAYPFLHMLRQMGFNVLAYDYPGYGKSTGHPNERRVYAAITACFGHLTKTLKIPTDKIVLFGRSLGTAPTLYIAKNQSVHCVILESPFLSAYRVLTRVGIFPFDKYQNVRYIKSVRSPILIIQGTIDDVIPFSHGQRLFEIAKPPKTHYWVKDAKHNDLIMVAGDNYWQTILNFINKTSTHE